MLHDLIARHGPLIVFVNVFAAAVGLPVPAMPTLVLFGAMAALHPDMLGAQLVPVLLLTVVAALLGDTVWYVAGRRFGGRTLKTLCRLSLSRDTCVRKTEHFFGRWGVRVLAVARFIPGLSLISVPMAGALGTRYRTFAGYDALGALLWAACGLLVGVLFSKQIDWLFAGANRLGRVALVVVVALLALYAAVRWTRRRALIRQLANARIEVEELDQLLQGDPAPVIFDMRSPEHRRLDPYAIPGAQFPDEHAFEAFVARYPLTQKFVIYCACPNEVTAALTARRLNRAGFDNALALRGGLDAWRDTGRALTTIAPPAADAPQLAPRAA
ncbi:DedA family protein/thiosulfate sulfurtransferase GlpE [Burkholderia sp. FERM BP-3421]|jgi:membrane protein DedA with SNARE-associated domain/rhodanese-related sulfurtransferase|uniref:DedA family protein/thiosulfate sulfurtransferase GlpE n=1 Tax=Burkholderia sp. FERM BP-3421 TaxID=1494466 RepID=UPI0023600F03|nr:DedA family protein/thiosulfate sulfurtransferase GlpE [Burkholderia sp. FERM BP-3421]WDD91172.1 DedA family protein/thiosulfate sulfurtransferase GlpE [Burkholderia sp. FERM BP-3421]